VTNLEEFKAPSNTIIVKVAAVYAVVLSTIMLFSSLQPAFDARFVVSSIAAWLVIGWCQFALFNALHEGLHNRFGRPHREFLANALTAYPLGFDAFYQRVHLDHHKHFGNSECDPDYSSYANFPSSKRKFIWRLLLNLSGYPALLQFIGVRQNSQQTDNTAARGVGGKIRLLKLLLAQLLILAIFGFTVGWLYYLWLWVIPLATFGKFFTSTRTFCEHASPDNQPTIRSITGSFLGEKILGVFCFHYHAEHHCYVAIPCNQLKAVHQAMQDSIYVVPAVGEPRYELYQRGYFQLLRGWYNGLPL
jgi:fatty acid desaturase